MLGVRVRLRVTSHRQQRVRESDRKGQKINEDVVANLSRDERLSPSSSAKAGRRG